MKASEKQALFLEGARYGRDYARGRGPFGLKPPSLKAKELFPIPTRTVPRELAINGLTYKVIDGKLHYRSDGWPAFERCAIVCVDDLDKINDLLDNPTHTVEVDA